jgi:hypothetical protein
VWMNNSQDWIWRELMFQLHLLQCDTLETVPRGSCVLIRSLQYLHCSPPNSHD